MFISVYVSVKQGVFFFSFFKTRYFGVEFHFSLSSHALEVYQDASTNLQNHAEVLPAPHLSVLGVGLRSHF